MSGAKGAPAAKGKHVHRVLERRPTMWRIGGSYTIEMWEDDDNNGLITAFYNCEVLEAAGTLVKIRQGTDEKILNTASMAFVSATPARSP